MHSTRTATHADAAASAALAAAICLAVSLLIGLILDISAISQNLLYGISLSAIAFGFTYAGVFFVAIARRR